MDGSGLSTSADKKGQDVDGTLAAEVHPFEVDVHEWRSLPRFLYALAEGQLIR
jgi:hypothetical protein